MIKGNILKKNTKTFTMENGKSYKCDQYRGKNTTIIVKKRNDEAIIGECESIIKNEEKEEELTLDKKKDGHSKVLSDRQNSFNSSNDSDNESDSDSGLDDSDDESDNEGNLNKKKVASNNSKNVVVPEFIDDLYGNESKNKKKNETQTVTYTINQNGETRTFEKTTTMEDRLDWEQAYHEKYAQNNDFVYSLIKGKKDETKLKKLNFMEIEKLNLKKITEDEYFNPSSTNNIHIGRIMNITEEKKIIKSKVKYWMVKKNNKFPISGIDILPIVKYITMILLDQVKSDKNSEEIDINTFKRITEDLFNLLKEKDTFPIKTCKN